MTQSKSVFAECGYLYTFIVGAAMRKSPDEATNNRYHPVFRPADETSDTAHESHTYPGA